MHSSIRLPPVNSRAGAPFMCTLTFVALSSFDANSCPPIGVCVVNWCLLFRCTVRPDFDLCASCERLPVRGAYPMLKIDSPEDVGPRDLSYVWPPCSLPADTCVCGRRCAHAWP